MAGLTAVASASKVAFFEKDAKFGSGFIPFRAEEPGDYDDSDRFLRRYRTHYVRIKIPRKLDGDIFSSRPYK
ncbi:MAG: hypothetical protein ABJG15_10720 [Hyphomonadaceae bacterium]